MDDGTAISYEQYASLKELNLPGVNPECQGLQGRLAQQGRRVPLVLRDLKGIRETKGIKGTPGKASPVLPSQKGLTVRKVDRNSFPPAGIVLPVTVKKAKKAKKAKKGKKGKKGNLGLLITRCPLGRL